MANREFISKKWIQGAINIKHKGEFTSWCKSHGFGGVTNACILEAKKVAHKNKDKNLMSQAIFAGRAQKGF